MHYLAIPDPDALLESNSHEFATQLDGIITDEEHISLGGHPALTVAIESPRGTYRVRLVAVVNRIYAAIGMSHSIQPGKNAADDIERFVKSLTVDRR
jgi:hypothetical protein